MENGNLQQALKRLMQDGIRNEDGQRAMGLSELMERLRNQRNQQLNRYNMASGVMDDLREKLEEIKQMERDGIQRRLDDTDQENQQQSPSGQPNQSGQSDQQQPGDQSSGQQSPDGQQGHKDNEDNNNWVVKVGSRVTRPNGSAGAIKRGWQW